MDGKIKIKIIDYLIKVFMAKETEMCKMRYSPKSKNSI